MYREITYSDGFYSVWNRTERKCIPHDIRRLAADHRASVAGGAIWNTKCSLFRESDDSKGKYRDTRCFGRYLPVFCPLEFRDDSFAGSTAKNGAQGKSRSEGTNGHVDGVCGRTRRKMGAC